MLGDLKNYKSLCKGQCASKNSTLLVQLKLNWEAQSGRLAFCPAQPDLA